MNIGDLALMLWFVNGMILIIGLGLLGLCPLIMMDLQNWRITREEIEEEVEDDIKNEAKD